MTCIRQAVLFFIGDFAEIILCACILSYGPISRRSCGRLAGNDGEVFSFCWLGGVFSGFFRGRFGQALSGARNLSLESLHSFSYLTAMPPFPISYSPPTKTP